MKIYRVVLGFYAFMETQETEYGYYSTREKAEERKKEVIKKYKHNPKEIYIYEIELDEDIDQ